MDMEYLRAFSSLRKSMDAQRNKTTDLSDFLTGDLWDTSSDTDNESGESGESGNTENIDFPTYLAQLFEAQTKAIIDKLDEDNSMIIDLLQQIAENTSKDT